MKWLVVTGFIVVVLGGIFFYNMKNNSSSSQPTATSTQPTASDNSSIKFCATDQLAGQLMPNVGAGNVYVQATIKNTSQTNCKIQANNPLSVDYPNSVQNIKTTQVGQASQSSLTLKPGQTVYSQLHYPNGPQCSSQLLGVNAGVSVKVSPDVTISFQPQGSSTLDIETCTAANEVTEIQTWPLSTTPITK